MGDWILSNIFLYIEWGNHMVFLLQPILFLLLYYPHLLLVSKVKWVLASKNKLGYFSCLDHFIYGRVYLYFAGLVEFCESEPNVFVCLFCE